jgi:cytochrome c-type biogenesis protein
MESTTFPLLTAFLLGLMTAISPCPLATNITAVGFISKDIENRNKVFINGLIYTLGRTVAYTLLAIIIMYSADQFTLKNWFQINGEKIIGPFLIIIGILMLDLVRIKFPGLSNLSGKIEKKGFMNYWNVFLLGVVFALAFCPYSGVLFFGMLMPLIISSPEGVTLAVSFAIATGIPVILFAWMIAYTLSGVGGVYNKVKSFEKWFRKIIAILFIATGAYYIIEVYFGVTIF